MVRLLPLVIVKIRRVCGLRLSWPCDGGLLPHAATHRSAINDVQTDQRSFDEEGPVSAHLVECVAIAIFAPL